MDANTGALEEVIVVPANEATWGDLDAIFDAYDARSCRCQRYKIRDKLWRSYSREARAELLREQTCCDDPQSPTTSGLVAYLVPGARGAREVPPGEPVGWCAVEPRNEYARLRYVRTPWTGRDEDKDDAGVWAVTCFVTRVGYRRRGVTYALTKAAVAFARDRGAAALEGYAMITEPGEEIAWGELHVGALRVYEEAGLREVSRPSKRRVVMRIDF
jgi:GNAT superfamily N-acetyltransferase